MPGALYIQNGDNDFNVSFENPCFMCQNPTRVILNVKNPFTLFNCLYRNMKPPDLFSRAFITWTKFFNMGLDYNYPMYRCFGGKARRVCYACFLHRYKHDVRHTETHGPVHRHRSISSTQKEILYWFGRCQEFWLRKDCDQYFVDFSDRWELHYEAPIG